MHGAIVVWRWGSAECESVCSGPRPPQAHFVPLWHTSVRPRAVDRGGIFKMSTARRRRCGAMLTTRSCFIDNCCEELAGAAL